jgi:hypothetical protein
LGVFPTHWGCSPPIGGVPHPCGVFPTHWECSSPMWRAPHPLGVFPIYWEHSPPTWSIPHPCGIFPTHLGCSPPIGDVPHPLGVFPTHWVIPHPMSVFLHTASESKDLRTGSLYSLYISCILFGERNELHIILGNTFWEAENLKQLTICHIIITIRNTAQCEAIGDRTRS